MKRILLIIIAMLFCIPFRAEARETFAQRHKTFANELYTPERITVGPDDNFEPQIDPDSGTVYFTRRERLGHKIYKQDIATGWTEPYVDQTADSKDPALSPDGRYFAFTFYKYDAKGDVCFFEIKKKGKGETCITDSSTRDKSPFWLGNEKLGFIEEKGWNEKSDVYFYNLKTKTKKKAFSGHIINPSGSRDGLFMTYIKILTAGPFGMRLYKVALRKMDTDKEYLFRMDIPGISSFPILDSLNEHVYFGHFMNDSTQDQVVDSRDAGVVLRVDVKKILDSNGSVITPEPLTSLEYNCNFPRPVRDKLYLTCAFNNSLDIYWLPKDGVVPANWDSKKQGEALVASRSYEDRILILMTAAYRDQSFVDKKYYERLFSDNYQAGELNTSVYILQILSAMSKRDEAKDFYDITRSVLTEEIAYSNENSRLIRGAFKKRIEKKINKLKKKIASYSNLNKKWVEVAVGCLKYMGGERQGALKILKNDLQKVDSQFVHYMRVSYLEKIYRKLNDQESLAHIFYESSQNGVFDEATKVYFAFNYLKVLDSMKVTKRKENLNACIVKSPKKSYLHELCSSDELLDKLASAVGKPEQQTIYNDIWSLIDRNKTKYYLSRSLLIRSINRLAKGAEWRYMYYIANFWISMTDKDSIEYSYAKDQYLYTSLDKAYGFFGGGQKSFAADEFYITLRLTDNLEAHHGFINSMIAAGKGGEINEKYAFLEKKGYTSENKHYKDAFINIYDPVNNRLKVSKSDLKKSIKTLEKLKTPIDHSGVKNLLLGYLYYKQIDFAVKPYEKKQLTDKAYRNFMLSLDLGRYSMRIKTQALMNLGLLYQKIGNFGKSLDYLRERGKLLFIDDSERVFFLWFYARALYYVNKPLDAYNSLKEALAAINDKKLSVVTYPFAEKSAFYLMAAKNYKEAKKVYEVLLAKNESDKIIDGRNRLKIESSYAFTLFMLGNYDQAEIRYKKIYADSKKFDVPKSKNGKIFKNPEAYRIQALGFMAQIEEDKSKAIDIRKERLSLLKKINAETLGYGYSLDDWRRLTIKEINNLAYLYWSTGQNERALALILEALPLTEDLFDSTLNAMDKAHVNTVRNTMLLSVKAIETGKMLDVKLGERVSRLSGETLKALEDTKDVVLSARYLKLKAELTIFNHAILRGYPAYKNDSGLKNELEALKNSNHWRRVAGSEVKIGKTKNVLRDIETWL